MAWWWGPKLALFYLFVLLWIMYMLQFNFVTRFYEDFFSKFVGFVGFQYNKGFRQKFARDFDLREPLDKDKKCVQCPEQRSSIMKPGRAVSIKSDSQKSGQVDANVGTDSAPKYPKDHHIKVAKMVSYSIDEFLMRNKKISYNITRNYGNEVAQRLNYYLLEYQEDVIKDNAVFKMINVDYYADMEYWLTLMKPIVMYTFVPEGVGGDLSNGSFSCNNDVWSIVRTDGSGGSHMIWDYGYEYCTIETCWGVLICPIEQFRVPEEPHYRVICVIPATWVPIPFSMLVRRRKLARLKVSYGPMNILRFVDITGRELLAMATLGSTVDYVMPADLFDILAMRNKMSTMSAKAIEQFLKQEGVSKEYIQATFIYQVFRNKLYPPPEGFRAPRVPMCEDARYRRNKLVPPREPRYVPEGASGVPQKREMKPLRRADFNRIHRLYGDRDTSDYRDYRDEGVTGRDITFGTLVIKTK